MTNIFFPLMLQALLFGGTVALVAKLKGMPWLSSGIKGASPALLSMLGLPGLGVILWLLALILVAATGGGDTGNETSAAAKAFGQGAEYVYVGGGTAIAVDTAKRVIRLKEGKARKEYAFSDIREWRTNIASGGQIFAGAGVGIGNAIAIDSQNIRNARENRKQTGLFLAVRDIDRPEWRIDMPSDKNQKRWMEILRQTINND